MSDNPLGSASSGDAPRPQDTTKIRRALQEEDETQTNVAIKDSLREKMRRQAFEEKRSLKSIVNEALAAYYLGK